MIQVDIKVEGLEEVVDMFHRATDAVKGPAQLRALSAGANVIADELEKNTPVRAENPSGGNSLDKGVLRESVMIRVELDKNNQGGTAYIGFGKYGYVANWLENGHRLLTHGMKSIRRVIGFVAPRPFMRQSLEASGQKAVDVYVETMRQELQTAGVPLDKSEAA